MSCSLAVIWVIWRTRLVGTLHWMLSPSENHLTARLAASSSWVNPTCGGWMTHGQPWWLWQPFLSSYVSLDSLSSSLLTQGQWSYAETQHCSQNWFKGISSHLTSMLFSNCQAVAFSFWSGIWDTSVNMKPI